MISCDNAISWLSIPYAIVCNQNVHTEQVKLMEQLFRKSGITEDTDDTKLIYEAAYEILKGNNLPDYTIDTVCDCFSRETKRAKEKLCRKILQIMCYDGSLDDVECLFLKTLYPDFQWRKGVIRRHISDYKSRVYGFRFILRRLLRSIIYLFKLPFSRSLLYLPKIRAWSRWKKRNKYKNAMKFLNRIIKNKRKRRGYIGDPALQSLLLQKVIGLQKEYELSLKKLESADLALALVGRTKAGKSTIFSILSGTSRKLIGSGTDRTTRIVMSGNLGRLRIADTPGLAAASSEGREDENITWQELSGIDYVCFVTNNDSNSIEINEFLKAIINFGKPVTVLINHKDNDSLEFDLEDFLKDPTQWNNSDDDGYENNLLRAADELKYAPMLKGKIARSFVQAAHNEILRSRYGIRSRTDRLRIIEASNLFQVVNQLLKKIEQNASFYREASYRSINLKMLTGLSEILQEVESNAKTGAKVLSASREKAIQSINLFHKNTCERIGEEVKLSFKEILPDESIFEISEQADNVFNNNMRVLCPKLLNCATEIAKRVLAQEYSAAVQQIRDMDVSLDGFGNAVYPLAEPQMQPLTVRTSKPSIFQSREFKKGVKALASFGAGATLTGPPGLLVALGISFIPYGNNSTSLGGLKDASAKERHKQLIDWENALLTQTIASASAACDEARNKVLSYIESDLNERIRLVDIRDPLEVRRKQLKDLFDAMNAQYARRALAQLQPHARFRNCQQIPDEEGEASDYMLCIYATHAHDDLFQDMKPRIRIVGV